MTYSITSDVPFLKKTRYNFDSSTKLSTWNATSTIRITISVSRRKIREKYIIFYFGFSTKLSIWNSTNAIRITIFVSRRKIRENYRIFNLVCCSEQIFRRIIIRTLKLVKLQDKVWQNIFKEKEFLKITQLFGRAVKWRIFFAQMEIK